MIVNISGASGTGKSTLIAYLESRYPQRYVRLVTYTCRQMRKGETQGNPYYFVGRADFEQEGYVLKRVRGEDVYAVRKTDLDTQDCKVLLAAFPARGVLKLEVMGYAVAGFHLHLESHERIRRMQKRGDAAQLIKRRILEDASESTLEVTTATMGTRSLHVLNARKPVEELAREINERITVLMNL